MARLRRLEVAGQVHLVHQQGRDGRKVFLDDEDRRSFCDALAFSARRWGVLVHAYALTDEQILLLLTPGTQGCLGRMMQQLNRRFVGALNASGSRHGPVWAGRYHATVIEPGPRVLAAMRWVECEPVVAGLAMHAVDWPWSSARHHAGVRSDPLVAHHASYWQLGNTPFEREAHYRGHLEMVPAPDERSDLIAKVRGGWPVGSELFLRSIALRTERRLTPGRKGRPPNTVPN